MPISKFTISEEEKNFLSEKMKEINDYCSQHGISLLATAKDEMNAFKAPNGFSIYLTQPKPEDGTILTKEDMPTMPLEFDHADTFDGIFVVAES